ncbi:MAG: hypothetical protein AUI14_18095 [Actinobacteria bacterium 13_2_20CM_2_71_6]|nr:MAG: hypothetical protein AUI14_18095 [Actinobacteria bacterium 13_2_20CM_2_71_6]
MARPAPAAGPGPDHQRRNLAIALGVGAVGLVLVLLVVTMAWGVSRATRSHPAHGSAPANRSTPTDANGCVWRPADPTTKVDQRDVGTPPSSPVRRIGYRTMTVSTNRGALTVRMDARLTPCTVASFSYLAGRHFFDKTSCHRLVTDGIYVLQCGDPSGTDVGGPTYVFPDEIARTVPFPRASGDGLVTYPRGTVALANSGKDTNGSQFFIVYRDSPIPPSYTPFGVVTKGLSVLDKVARAGDDGAYAPDPGGGHPKLPVVITSLTVS